jgi:hypothetical protein
MPDLVLHDRRDSLDVIPGNDRLGVVVHAPARIDTEGAKVQPGHLAQSVNRRRKVRALLRREEERLGGAKDFLCSEHEGIELFLAHSRG